MRAEVISSSEATWREHVARGWSAENEEKISPAHCQHLRSKQRGSTVPIGDSGRQSRGKPGGNNTLGTEDVES